MRVFKYKKITIKPCTIRQYELIKYAKQNALIMSAAQTIVNNNVENMAVKLDFDEIAEFCIQYILWAENEKNNDETLQIPYAPTDDKPLHYNPVTRDKKMVSDYTGLNFNEIESIDIFTYWLYLRDAFIWTCSKTESGQKYLEDAYYYNNTEIDRNALRQLFGGGNNGK